MLNRLPPYRESPSQTAGPYVHIGCTPNYAKIAGVWHEDLGAAMVGPDTKGLRIAIEGRITDGNGAPVTDAIIEVWQADASGIYPGRGDARGGADPAFRGFGRQAADLEGRYAFATVKPGRVPHADGGTMAPHINVWIAARGINIGLQTRMYFSDEAAANAEDPVLRRVPDPRRRTTLVAVRRQDVAGQGPAAAVVYTFDVRLQGENETVFFDV